MRFEAAREITQEREALERRWRDRLIPEPRLATLVTAQGNAREPFHRWLPYRQGFSPGLVRLFLSEFSRGSLGGPILDPFSGSGTTTAECARQRCRAVGVEAVPALVFVAAAKFEDAWHEIETIDDVPSWEPIAERLTLPLHRAALMIAQSRRHTGSGALNRGAPSIAQSLRSVADMMREDLGQPMALINETQCGDARTLEGVGDSSCNAMITSPPYLARYDYARTNDPLECVYRHWYGAPAASNQGRQLRAASNAHDSSCPTPEAQHRATEEAHRVLVDSGHQRQAGAVRDYFSDMNRVLVTARRVLAPGAPVWMVIGGVRLKDVYVATDLIIAEMAESVGFEIEAIRVARDLNPIRRKFGSAGHLAPRESALVLRNP